LRIVNSVLKVVTGLLQKLLPPILTIIQTVLPSLITLIEKLLPVVTRVIETVLPVLIDMIEKLFPIISSIIETVLPVLIDLVESLIPIIEFVAELVGSVLSAAFEGIAPVIEAVMQILTGLIDFLTGVFTGNWEKAWNGVKDIFGGIFDAITGILKTAVNALISGINVFLGGLNKLTIPDWVPGVGGKGFSIPLIPMLAKGSDFSPETFIAGEEGPELVTGAKGKKVFTASETSGIFQTLKDIARAATVAASPMTETVSQTQQSTTWNNNVTQNIDITNTFNGDRAGQRRSAEAMGKASGIATDELARALINTR
jgi:hypothetical protein